MARKSISQEQLRALGIVEDREQLKAPTRPFDLPAETDEAAGLAYRLIDALQQIRRAHPRPDKGVGIAAPQIGVDRALAVYYPPTEDEFIILVNPRIVFRSHETDLQWEGCLSTWELRNRVERSLRIIVEYSDLFGELTTREFTGGDARLIQHEVDHLNGVLCVDLVPDGEALVSRADYELRTDTGWSH